MDNKRPQKGAPTGNATRHIFDGLPVSRSEILCRMYKVLNQFVGFNSSS